MCLSQVGQVIFIMVSVANSVSLVSCVSVVIMFRLFSIEVGVHVVK